MRVLLARHGETTGNRDGLILGQKDYPLTDKGVQTASKLAGQLAAYGKGIIFTSALGRAKQTSKIYADRTGWDVVETEGMIELACGQWEGHPRSVVAPDRPFLRMTWADSPPGGESYGMGEMRVTGVIEKIKAMQGYDLVLVVGHAGINRVFLKVWLQLDPGQAMSINPVHGLIYILGTGGIIGWMDENGGAGPGWYEEP
jgi:broad specificity phosphatase PhoE